MGALDLRLGFKRLAVVGPQLTVNGGKSVGPERSVCEIRSTTQTARVAMAVLPSSMHEGLLQTQFGFSSEEETADDGTVFLFLRYA